MTSLGLIGSAQECASAIREAHNVLAICHVEPDGDAIGSLLGLGWILHLLGIEHTLACPSPAPAKMHFLPRSRPIIAQPGSGYDLLVAVDCNNIDRLGDIVNDPQVVGLRIVNIDHHVTNTLFGAVNWIDSTAAATAEMVYALAEAAGVTIMPEMATCLLTGIVTDTWGFRTPSTTPRTLETALKAMQAGANLPDIVARTIDSRSYASLCLWARAIMRAKLEDGVLWAAVTQEDFRTSGAGRDGQNGLVNFLLSANEARVSVLLTESEERSIDVSFRSVPGIDVSDVAVMLGGGGHPQAAGVTLKMTLEEARQRVREALRQSLTRQGILISGHES